MADFLYQDGEEVIEKVTVSLCPGELHTTDTITYHRHLVTTEDDLANTWDLNGGGFWVVDGTGKAQHLNINPEDDDAWDQIQPLLDDHKGVIYLEESHFIDWKGKHKMIEDIKDCCEDDISKWAYMPEDGVEKIHSFTHYPVASQSDFDELEYGDGGCFFLVYPNEEHDPKAIDVDQWKDIQKQLTPNLKCVYVQRVDSWSDM